MNAPNLARDPFVNRRPVERLTVALWVLAVALFGVNGWLYWGHFSGRGQQQSELAEVEAGMADERRLLNEAMAVLEGYDLEWQREQVTFLNARIAERAFSWSALFDHLAEVLPRNVRVERVTPRVADLKRVGRGNRRRAAEDEVELELTGAAEEDAALLVLLDAFFAHERFERPSLKVETHDESSSQVSFSMSVAYSPVKPAVARPPKKIELAGGKAAPPEEAGDAEVAVEVAS
ncbi:MAG: hypothetical protein O7A04_01290 [Acidobacteria bacterium]|nr:hypothetical protein [Acidobacteriota bacterium]